MGKTFHFQYVGQGTYLGEAAKEVPDGTHLFNDFHFRVLGGAPLTFLYAIEDLTIPADTSTVHFGDMLTSEDGVPAWAGTIRNIGANVGSNDRMVATTIAILVDDDYENLTCSLVIDAFETGFLSGSGEVAFLNGSFVVGIVNSDPMDSNDPDYVSELLEVVSFWLEMDSTTTHNTIFAVGPWESYHRGAFEAGLGDNPDGSDIGTGMDLSFAADRTYHATGISGSINPHWAQLAGHETDDHTLAEMETHLQMKVRSAGTFTNLRGYVTLNSCDGTATVRRRINSANGNGNIVLSPRESGFVAGTGTDAVVDGDLVNYAVTCSDATGGTIFLLALQSNFTATGTTVDIYCNKAESFNSYAAYFTDLGAAHITAEQYIPINGGWSHATAASRPAANRYLDCPFGTTFSQLRAYVGYFNGADYTLGTFINGAHGNQVLTIDGTGWFEDTTHTDVLAGCDRLICYYAVSDGEAITHIDNISMTYIAGTEAVCDPEEPGGPGGPCELDCPGGMTFSGLKHRALKMLGEDWASPVYWTNAEIGRYVNDAYTAICRDTKALEYIEAIALTEDTAGGTLSSYVGPIFRATWDDRKIDNVTKWELDRSLPDWEAETGFVRNYVTTLHDERTISTYPSWDGSEVNAYEHFYNDGAYTYSVWVNGASIVTGDRRTVIGTDGKKRAYVAITDHTAVTATNKPGSGTDWQTNWSPLSLMVWCVKNPALLSDTCDTPELPPWSHIAIAYLAAARALLKRGEMRDEALAAAYESIAGDYTALLKGLVAQRTPERLVALGGRARSGLRRPMPWDRLVVP